MGWEVQAGVYGVSSLCMESGRNKTDVDDMVDIFDVNSRIRCVELGCVLLLLGLGLVTEKVVRSVRESVLSIIDMVCPGCFEESHLDKFTIALMEGLFQNCIGP